MPLTTARKAIIILCSQSKRKNLTVEFHGGEPLLLSKNFFSELISEGNAWANMQGKRLSWRTQTNGTRLDDDSLNLLDQLSITFGLSLDGPPHLNNQLRERGEQVVEAIARIKRRGKEAHVITVLGPHNATNMKTVVHYFTQVGVSYFQLNLMTSNGRGSMIQPLTLDQLVQAHVTTAEAMFCNPEGALETNWILRMRQLVDPDSAQAQNPSLCRRWHCQAGRAMIVVQMDGTVSGCDNLRDDDASELGNIAGDNPLDQQTLEQRITGFHSDRMEDLACFTCPARTTCLHGCRAQWGDKEQRKMECTLERVLFNFLDARRPQVEALVQQINERQLRKDFLFK